MQGHKLRRIPFTLPSFSLPQRQSLLDAIQHTDHPSFTSHVTFAVRLGNGFPQENKMSNDLETGKQEHIDSHRKILLELSYFNNLALQFTSTEPRREISYKCCLKCYTAPNYLTVMRFWVCLNDVGIDPSPKKNCVFWVNPGSSKVRVERGKILWVVK